MFTSTDILVKDPSVGLEVSASIFLIFFRFRGVDNWLESWLKSRKGMVHSLA